MHNLPLVTSLDKLCARHLLSVEKGQQGAGSVGYVGPDLGRPQLSAPVGRKQLRSMSAEGLEEIEAMWHRCRGRSTRSPASRSPGANYEGTFGGWGPHLPRKLGQVTRANYARVTGS